MQVLAIAQSKVNASIHKFVTCFYGRLPYISTHIYLYVLVWWRFISAARSLFRGDVGDVVLNCPGLWYIDFLLDCNHLGGLWKLSDLGSSWLKNLRRYLQVQHGECLKPPTSRDYNNRKPSFFPEEMKKPCMFVDKWLGTYGLWPTKSYRKTGCVDPKQTG